MLAATAAQLARKGVQVDVFTRATRPSQGEVVEVAPGYRVINIVAGPYEGLAKEDLPGQLCAFTAGILRADGFTFDTGDGTEDDEEMDEIVREDEADLPRDDETGTDPREQRP